MEIIGGQFKIYGVIYDHIEPSDIEELGNRITSYFDHKVENDTDLYNIIYSAVALLAENDTTTFRFTSTIKYTYLNKCFKNNGEYIYALDIKSVLPLVKHDVAKALVANISDRVSSYYDIIDSGTKSARNV